MSTTTSRFDTIAEAATALKRREVSPSELLESTLADVDRRAPAANCYITVMAESARARAASLERAGHTGAALWGIPMSVKDCLATTTAPTTAGSPILADFTPTSSAVVVQRLERAGAILFAKDNMYDFAYCGPNPQFGDAINPWAKDRTCGGSSNGSASAVASGLSYASLGTDGGGSIRMPSSFCGVVGLKPTTGLVNGAGELPCQGSLSCIGPIGRTVDDTRRVLSAIADVEPEKDADSGLADMRLGVSSELTAEVLDPDVRAAFDEACAVLRNLGATLHEISMPSVRAARAIMWVISGVEYAEALRTHVRRSPDRLHPFTRMLLERSEYVPATEYVHAQRARARIAHDLLRALSDVDAIVTPTTPIPAYKREQTILSTIQGDEHPLSISALFTAIFNVSGQPALTIPCGLSSDGLPIGLQIAGRPLDDLNVLRIGQAYEASAGWPDRALSSEGTQERINRSGT